jgi:hypothetical protein
MREFGQLGLGMMHLKKFLQSGWFLIFRQFYVSCRIMRALYEMTADEIRNLTKWEPIERLWLAFGEQELFLTNSLFAFPIPVNFLFAPCLAQLAWISEPQAEPFVKLLGCDLPTFVVQNLWQKNIIPSKLPAALASILLAKYISHPTLNSTQIWVNLVIKHQVRELCQFYDRNSFHIEDFVRLDMLSRVYKEIDFSTVDAWEELGPAQEDGILGLWHVFHCQTDLYNSISHMDRGFIHLELKEGTKVIQGKGFFSNWAAVTCESSMDTFFEEPLSLLLDPLTRAAGYGYDYALESSGKIEGTFIGGLIIATNLSTGQKSACARWIAYRDCRQVTPILIDDLRKTIEQRPGYNAIETVQESMPELPRADIVTLMNKANTTYNELLDLATIAYRASHWAYSATDWLYAQLSWLERRGADIKAPFNRTTEQGPFESERIYTLRCQVQTFASRLAHTKRPHLLLAKFHVVKRSWNTISLHISHLANPLPETASPEQLLEREDTRTSVFRILSFWRLHFLIWENQNAIPSSDPFIVPRTSAELAAYFKTILPVMEQDFNKILSTVQARQTAVDDLSPFMKEFKTRPPNKSTVPSSILLLIGGLAALGAIGGLVAWWKLKARKRFSQPNNPL